MSFVDKVNISVKAGSGGNGKLSFRHEKYVAKGGPDGGDGGNGGNVILEASTNQNTLAAFRYKKELKAEDGHSGERRKKHGKNGQDLIVKVPVGTVAITSEGKIIADLVEDHQTSQIAAAGKGGYGNAHFVSSRRQAPNFAEKGEPGEALNLTLELKVIADVGIVGLPNVGKSTLLAKISNASPEIANYPFTTLVPNLGVVDIDENTSILFADIPGLIEGAAEGKGLGHDFLKHIERTAVILHLIDAYSEDVVKAYLTVREELKTYELEIAKKPEVVALTKIEGLDKDIVSDLTDQLKKVVPKKTPILSISSQSSEGLKPLLFEIAKQVKEYRKKPKSRLKKPSIPRLTLPRSKDSWSINKIHGGYKVSGEQIERFASRTDFNNPEGLQRLRDIMRRGGIMHELQRKGLEPGDRIQIGDNESNNLIY